MVQEYIWRSEQEPTKYNPMSTLIVSFHEILKKLNVDIAKKNQTYTMHILIDQACEVVMLSISIT